MESRSAKARVRLEYKVQYQNPLHVKAGESVEVGRADDDDLGWLWCRAADGREGWMPVELLSRQECLAIVLRDYSARELAVHPGMRSRSKRCATVGRWPETLEVKLGGFRNRT